MTSSGARLVLLVTFVIAALPHAAAAIPAGGMSAAAPLLAESASPRGDAAPERVAHSDAARVDAAAAQKAATAVKVQVAPVREPVEPGARATTTARVQYCYEVAGAFGTDEATKIRFGAHLRNWYDAVGVSVTPETVTIDPVVPAEADAWTCAPPRVVNVTVEPWYPFRDEVAVVVTASAAENAPLVASEGEDALTVVYARQDPAPATSLEGVGPARVQAVVESAATGIAVVPVALLGLTTLAAAGGLFLVRRE